MSRLLQFFVLAIGIYFWGTPSLEGWRPAPLERPLTRFSTDINSMIFLGIEFVQQLPQSPAGKQFFAYRQQADELIYAYFGK